METVNNCPDQEQNEINSENKDESKSVPPEKMTEGKRMTFLRKALNKTTEKCFSADRFEVFARCYPEVTKKNTSALRDIHRQYIQQLHSSIKSEIDLMCEEEEVIKLLNNLDAILDEAASDPKQLTWRPSGDAKADVSAHSIPILEQQRERLQQILQEAEKDNLRLQRSVEKQRSKLGKTEAEATEMCETFVQAATELTTEDMETVLLRVKDINNS